MRWGGEEEEGRRKRVGGEGFGGEGGGEEEEGGETSETCKMAGFVAAGVGRKGCCGRASGDSNTESTTGLTLH